MGLPEALIPIGPVVHQGAKSVVKSIDNELKVVWLNEKELSDIASEGKFEKVNVVDSSKIVTEGSIVVKATPKDQQVFSNLFDITNPM